MPNLGGQLLFKSRLLGFKIYQLPMIHCITYQDFCHHQCQVLLLPGCLAHWLNLLKVDITPTAIMKHVVEVHMYFRNHHKPAAWLKECSKIVRPQLPGDTSWTSQLTSLDTFLNNQPHFIQIAQEHEDDIDNTIIQKVMDYNLYCQSKELAEQLRAIAAAIDRAQIDSAGLADTCDIFLHLLEHWNLKPHHNDGWEEFQASHPAMSSDCLHALPRWHSQEHCGGVLPVYNDINT